MKSQKMLMVVFFLFIFSSIIQFQNGKSIDCNCTNQYIPSIQLITPQYSNVWGENISLSWEFYANHIIPPTDICVMNFTLKIPDGTSVISILTNTTISLLPTSYRYDLSPSVQINDTFTFNWSIGYRLTNGSIFNYHRSIIFTWIGLIEPTPPASESIFTNIWFWVVIISISIGVVIIVLVFRKRTVPQSQYNMYPQQPYYQEPSQQPYQEQYTQPQQPQLDCNDPQNLYNNPTCIQAFQSQYGITPQEYNQQQIPKQIKKI